jgi:hypothetical protein
MNRKLWFTLVAAGVCLAQAPEPAQRIEVRLERNRGGAVEQLPPDFVCDNGDLVRFRFKLSFDGYLYVANLATSGKYSQLFPSSQATNNRVEKGREYVLPAGDTGWFRLDAPAGYEMVYWLVSRVRLSERRNPAPPDTAGSAAPAITPRCDDALFRARGDCIDRSAGARAIRSKDELPPPLADLRPRELDLTTAGNTTAVTAQGEGDEPFIYAFRLAHR